MLKTPEKLRQVTKIESWLRSATTSSTDASPVKTPQWLINQVFRLLAMWANLPLASIKLECRIQHSNARLPQYNPGPQLGLTLLIQPLGTDDALIQCHTALCPPVAVLRDAFGIDSSDFSDFSRTLAPAVAYMLSASTGSTSKSLQQLGEVTRMMDLLVEIGHTKPVEDSAVLKQELLLFKKHIKQKLSWLFAAATEQLAVLDQLQNICQQLQLLSVGQSWNVSACGPYAAHKGLQLGPPAAPLFTFTQNHTRTWSIRSASSPEVLGPLGLCLPAAQDLLKQKHPVALSALSSKLCALSKEINETLLTC